MLQFDYDGYRINLLDTPGHKDFSEDTYRVRMCVIVDAWTSTSAHMARSAVGRTPRSRRNAVESANGLA